MDSVLRPSQKSLLLVVACFLSLYMFVLLCPTVKYQGWQSAAAKGSGLTCSGRNVNLSASADISFDLFEHLWPQSSETVWMSEQEARMIVKYLGPQHIMWEWGSGGSTTLFPLFVGAYYSIEHNAGWSLKVQERLVAAHLTEKVDYRHVPMSQKPTGGSPSRGADYAQYIMSVPDELKFDRVLIDGRARPQCAFEALWHFRDYDDAVLFLHDFWMRAHYHVVFWVYDLVDAHFEGQSLVLLRPKPNWQEQLRIFPHPTWWLGDAAPEVNIIHATAR